MTWSLAPESFGTELVANVALVRRELLFVEDVMFRMEGFLGVHL